MAEGYDPLTDPAPAHDLRAVVRMQRDIFPDLGVPVLYVAQPYGGMDPAQMEGFITNYYEYHFLYINGIEHVESKSIQGITLIKLQFHPGTNMAGATPFVGDTVRFAIVGGFEIGDNTLIRWYVLHVIALPLVAALFMVVHFWRIRKDGGIAGPL